MTSYRLALDLQEQVLRATFMQVKGLITHNAEGGGLVESIFRNALERILPGRLGLTSGFVIDSTGAKSRQLDVIIYDKMGLPALFSQSDVSLIPVEVTLAAGEIKTTLDTASLKDCYVKCRSYKSLVRTAYIGSGVRGYSDFACSVYGPPEPCWPSLFFVLALTGVSVETLLDSSMTLINSEGFNGRSKVDTAMVLGLDKDQGSVLLNGTRGPEVTEDTKISFVCEDGMNLKSYPARSPWALFCYLLTGIMSQTPEFLVDYKKYDDGRAF